MRFVIALALLACGSAWGQANSAAITCTAPTTNTDGSTLTAAQKPLTFTFYEGTISGSQPNASPAQSGCAYTFTGLAAGTHYFSAAVTDKLGTSSARTAPVSKAVVNPTPSPPTNLAVAADLTAWVLAPSTNKVALLAVGSFTPGTQCDPSQPVLDKFVVLVDAAHPVVKPASSTNKSVVFLGTCG